MTKEQRSAISQRMLNLATFSAMVRDPAEAKAMKTAVADLGALLDSGSELPRAPRADATNLQRGETHALTDEIRGLLAQLGQLERAAVGIVETIHFHSCPECCGDNPCTDACTIEPDLEDRGRRFGSHLACRTCLYTTIGRIQGWADRAAEAAPQSSREALARLAIVDLARKAVARG